MFPFCQISDSKTLGSIQQQKIPRFSNLDIFGYLTLAFVLIRADDPKAVNPRDVYPPGICPPEPPPPPKGTVA